MAKEFNNQNNKNSPFSKCCKGCEERKPNCHSTCAKYKEAKKLHNFNKKLYNEKKIWKDF